MFEFKVWMLIICGLSDLFIIGNLIGVLFLMWRVVFLFVIIIFFVYYLICLGCFVCDFCMFDFN